MSDRRRELESSLKGKDYSALEKVTARLDVEGLVELLNSGSIKIGDMAAEELAKRNCYQEIIDAVLESRVTTRFGKIRSVNTLFGAGRRYPKAREAYLLLLSDKSDEIAVCVLFNLVFWNDKSLISAIKERQSNVSASHNLDYFQRACEAIEKSNPKIFAPNFSDTTGAWR